MLLKSIPIIGLMLLSRFSGFGFPLEDWEKMAFTEIAKTPNALTWEQWNGLKEFEKQALYETRHVKRTDAKLAYSISQRPKSVILSVDEPPYYKVQRIDPSVNIPATKFTDDFIKKNLKWFQQFDCIIVYCR